MEPIIKRIFTYAYENDVHHLDLSNNSSWIFKIFAQCQAYMGHQDPLCGWILHYLGRGMATILMAFLKHVTQLAFDPHKCTIFFG